MQRKVEGKKTFILLVVAGIVLLTVTIGTVAGAGSSRGGSECPTCNFEPTYPFLMGDDGTTCSSCGGPRPSEFSVLFSDDIPIRPKNCDYENPSLISYMDDLRNNSDPNMVIVDVRTPEQYAEGHIQGAINLDWANFRKEKGVFIGVENATMILGKHGINQENEIIVYCSSATGTQCPASYYVFWMLEYLGHEHVSVLDGGFNAWCSVAYGYSQNETTRAPTTYTAHVVDERFADTEWVQNNLNNSGVQIADARTTEDYKAGHIAGAININYENLFRDGDRLKGADELKWILSPVVIAGLDKKKDTVVYCASGASASILYLALRMMGYQVRNYEGSWNVWCDTHPGLTIPISNVSVNPSSAYKGDTVKIYADVGINSSEMKGEPAGTSLIPIGRNLPYIPGAGCAYCGGASAVPISSSSGTSFVRGYIYDGNGATVKIVIMHDDIGDRRYVGEWETDTAEAGIYYVDIVASDGVLTTPKKNAATLEVVSDTVGP
jgi:thiosulfate/3-mercaptopyruvate sulfurtransferase